MLAAVLLVTVPNGKPPKAHPSGMDARIYSHNGIQKMEFRQQKIHSVRNSPLLLQTQPAESARYHLCERSQTQKGVSFSTSFIRKVQEQAKPICDDRSGWQSTLGITRAEGGTSGGMETVDVWIRVVATGVKTVKLSTRDSHTLWI